MTILQIASSVAGALLLLLALPLVLELAVLSVAALLPPRRRLAPQADSYRLAVVIPAHNEQTLIGACVASLQHGAAPALTIYVVAHNCSDATAGRAMAAGAQVLTLDGPGGKGLALDHGFAHALQNGAEGVLVIDADSIVAPSLTHVVAARLAAGAAAVQCRYQVANAGASTPTRLAALAFLGMNILRPRGRDRLGLSSGIFGNGFALAATTLRTVPYTANSLVEDLEYHLNLLRANLRVEFVDDTAVFGEMPTSSTAATSQRARWEGGRILMRRVWTRPILRELFAGRIILLEPLLDLLAFPLATEAMLLTAALILGLGTHLLWLTLAATCGLLTLALYILVAATLGPQPAASLRALALAPAYLLWKIWLIPKTRVAARRNATWVRTARNADTSRKMTKRQAS